MTYYRGQRIRGAGHGRYIGRVLGIRGANSVTIRLPNGKTKAVRVDRTRP